MQVLHVFILFVVVNLFDVIVFDFGVFCYSKKLRIAGTADMDKEYESVDAAQRNYCTCGLYSSRSCIQDAYDPVHREKFTDGHGYSGNCSISAGTAEGTGKAWREAIPDISCSF